MFVVSELYSNGFVAHEPYAYDGFYHCVVRKVFVVVHTSLFYVFRVGTEEENKYEICTYKTH